jgi:hypothetical protein
MTSKIVWDLKIEGNIETSGIEDIWQGWHMRYPWFTFRESEICDVIETPNFKSQWKWLYCRQLKGVFKRTCGTSTLDRRWKGTPKYHGHVDTLCVNFTSEKGLRENQHAAAAERCVIDNYTEPTALLIHGIIFQ